MFCAMHNCERLHQSFSHESCIDHAMRLKADCEPDRPCLDACERHRTVAAIP